ncbi:MAG: hypothetical protein HW405_806 [Candidatus Berkelbacteria bacterium]|nr:hypothetical protein [Candidatus Berkelbacteria bacterium]
MKKILMITTSEIFHDTRILNEAKTLSRSYEVKILARKYPLQKSIKTTFKIKLIKSFKTKYFPINIILSLLSLMKATFKENVDIFHAHDLDGLLCAFPAALIRRKILIYDSHELWSNTYPFVNLGGIQWLFGPLEKILLLKVKSGITVNDSIAKYLSHRYNKDFFGLYNFSLSKTSKNNIHLKRLFPHKKVILHLGSADEGRGLEEMVGAVKFLSDKYILIFLGGGKTENIIKQKVKEYHLEKKIFFLPAVSPDKIISTIKEADLGLALTQKVSKSYYYSLPNKIFQYISARLPILGSNFPEFEKIIVTRKIGKVVDPSNSREIAQQIRSIIRRQKYYNQNYQKITNNYTWARESQKLIEFYQNLDQPKIEISRRFKIDVFTNVLSLGFLGMVGILLNIIIAKFYGSKGLGTFNEVYAIYIISSQFAVGSVHLSIQKYIPAYLTSKNERNKLISSGIILTIIFSIFISTMVFFSRNLWGIWFKNDQVSLGVALVAFGLIGFALNKSMLAVLNGFRLMRVFALFSALRYFFIVLSVVILAILKFPLGVLPLSFTIAESVLFILIFIYTLRLFKPVIKDLKHWLYKHLLFTYKSLLGNVLLDINTRVDILVLGFFVLPSQVGIYSFAALLVEGIGQLLSGVLKFNVNPILAKFSDQKRSIQMEHFVRRGIKLTYVYFLILTAVLVVLYPIFIKLFLGPEFYPSVWVFSILMIALAFSSGYQPFQMLLAQTGFPALYSWSILIVFIVNLVGNIILIPLFGIYGSAIATGCSFIALATGVKLLTRRALKIKI